MNLQLLKDALEDAKASPENFNMRYWGAIDRIYSDDFDFVEIDNVEDVKAMKAECGTTFCLAGFIARKLDDNYNGLDTEEAVLTAVCGADRSLTIEQELENIFFGDFQSKDLSEITIEEVEAEVNKFIEKWS